jgi:hypothetical protein
MKIVELLNNVGLQISNEEADLLHKFDDQPINREQFSERQIHIANQLVNKDVLLRRNQDGKTTYSKKIKS